MDVDRLRALLAAVQSGDLSPDEALQRLRRLPFEDLGFARLDTHRALRSGSLNEALLRPRATTSVPSPPTGERERASWT